MTADQRLAAAAPDLAAALKLFTPYGKPLDPNPVKDIQLRRAAALAALEKAGVL